MSVNGNKIYGISLCPQRYTLSAHAMTRDVTYAYFLYEYASIFADVGCD